MYFIKTPTILKALYSDLIWDVKTNKKEIFLTFDDGPVPEVTPQVLLLLEKYNAKATFFCIAHNVEKHPDVFRSILEKGHTVGNHTYNHLNGWTTKNFTYYRNILSADALLSTKLFRPPYGKITRQQAKTLKARYKIIMWDVLSADFDGKITPEQCAQNVIQKAGRGSIVVFHDSIKAKEKMLYALNKTLDYFSKQGFEFKKLIL